MVPLRADTQMPSAPLHACFDCSCHKQKYIFLGNAANYFVICHTLECPQTYLWKPWRARLVKKLNTTYASLALFARFCNPKFLICILFLHWKPSFLTKPLIQRRIAHYL